MINLQINIILIVKITGDMKVEDFGNCIQSGLTFQLILNDD